MRQLLAEMDAGEFAEWQAYFNLAPFGPMADDLRFGTIAAVVHNVTPGPKRKAKQPSDFALGKKAAGRATAGDAGDVDTDRLTNQVLAFFHTAQSHQEQLKARANKG